MCVVGACVCVYCKFPKSMAALRGLTYPSLITHLLVLWVPLLIAGCGRAGVSEGVGQGSIVIAAGCVVISRAWEPCPGLNTSVEYPFHVSIICRLHIFI
jgi:hypothetical protein